MKYNKDEIKKCDRCNRNFTKEKIKELLCRWCNWDDIKVCPDCYGDGNYLCSDCSDKLDAMSK